MTRTPYTTSGRTIATAFLVAPLSLMLAGTFLHGGVAGGFFLPMWAVVFIVGPAVVGLAHAARWVRREGVGGCGRLALTIATESARVVVGFLKLTLVALGLWLLAAGLAHLSRGSRLR